jgi:predicted RNase H-like nuclease
MRVLGVDAYRKGRKGKGWIGVELDRGTFVDAHIADRLTKLLSAVNDIQAVGIDMPLGLVETGRRQADLAAHAFVGKHLGSAVFLMPLRAVWKREDNTWYDDSWEQANQRCRQLTRGDELSPDGYGCPPLRGDCASSSAKPTSVLPPTSTHCTRCIPRCPSPP